MTAPQDEDPGGGWVDVVHVGDRYASRLTSAQRTRVAVLLRDAESILRRRVPTIAERIDAESLPISEVRRVVAQAVIRALDPGGGRLTQYSSNQGPFGESRGYAQPRQSGPERTGGVQFTEEELDDLREQSGRPDGIGRVDQRLPGWRVP